MMGLDKAGLANRAASGLGRIRTRTWLILGAALLAVTGLIVAAGIAALVWLWGQAPAAIDAGKRYGGAAVAQVEQATPGLWQWLDHWLPGVREQLQRWIPGLVPPAQDVSGQDIGPVPRYPGLVRSHFARDAKAVEVRFVGSAAFDAVLGHYVKGFAAAGFKQQVLAATPEREAHRFVRERETFELTVLRAVGGRVEVQLKQILAS